MIWPSVYNRGRQRRFQAEMRAWPPKRLGYSCWLGQQKPLLCLTWPFEPCLVCRAEFILLPLSQAISALIIPRGLQLTARFPRISGRVAEDSVLRSQRGSLAENPWLIIPAEGLSAYPLTLKGVSLTGCTERAASDALRGTGILQRRKLVSARSSPHGPPRPLCQPSLNL